MSSGHPSTSSTLSSSSSGSSNSYFVVLPQGISWECRSEDVPSMTRFLDEFTRRTTDGEEGKPQLVQFFKHLVDLLGETTCAEVLEQCKQEKATLANDHNHHSSRTTTTTTSATAISGGGGNADQGDHTSQNSSHGGISDLHDAAATALQSFYAGGRSTNPPSQTNSSAPSAPAPAPAAITFSGNPPKPPVVPPATLSWGAINANGTAIPIPIANSSTSTGAIDIMPQLPAGSPSSLSPRAALPAVDSPSHGSAAAHEETTVSSTATNSRKRARPSAVATAAASASAALAPAPSPSPSSAAATAATTTTGTTTDTTSLGDTHYIPTPRNDGPWPYMGALPAGSSSPSSSLDAALGVAGGGGGGGGGGVGRVGTSTDNSNNSGGSAPGSGAGSEEDDDSAKNGTGKPRPAAMNFGRYGDNLPYNGRKICRVKGCDGNQRWPDYLCGKHGGGRCRWEGCTLFHQGINSMGLLLCGKHCKAVGASYRRPQKPCALGKAGGGGGGGGAGGGSPGSYDQKSSYY